MKASYGRVQLLLRRSILRNALRLGIGSLIAQAIAIGASPVLTRMFSPEVFGVFGTFITVASLLGSVSALRLETALLLAEKGWQRHELLRLAIWSVGSVTIVVSVSAAIWWIGSDGTSALVTGSMYFLGPSVLALGLYCILSAALTRAGDFKTQVRYQIVRSMSGVVLQISLGLTSGSWFVFLATQVASQWLGLAVALWPYRRYRRGLGEVARSPRLGLLCQVRAYPLFAVPQTIANSLSNNSPVFVLAAMSGSSSVGYFYLVNRVLTLPSQLIAESLRNSMLHRLLSQRSEPQALRRSVLTAIAGLAAVGSPVLVVLVAFGPTIFSTVFGVEWADAGRYGQILAVPWLIQLMAVPVSVSIVVLERQRAFLIYEVVNFALRAAGMVVGGWTFGDFGAVAGFSILGSACTGVWIGFNLYWLSQYGSFDRAVVEASPSRSII